MPAVVELGDRLLGAADSRCRSPVFKLRFAMRGLHRAVVIDLAACKRVVARFAKDLRQRYSVLRDFHVANPGPQPINAGSRGTQACQQAAPRWIAQRGLAMGVCEQRSTFGQRIDVGSLNLRMPAQAADPIVQIIDRDEQDIWPLVVFLLPKGKGGLQEDRGNGKYNADVDHGKVLSEKYRSC